MDSLGSLNVFVHAAEQRSFVEAGRVLGVSAAAVGKSIVRLERGLGVRLFHRSTRSVTLTDAGRMFLLRCRRILAEADAAQAELSAQRASVQGRLRISLPLVSEPLLPMLADFMAAYPDVVLDLDFTDRVVDVIEEGFDAVLRVGEPSDSRLAARYIGRFQRRLVASPDYLRARGTPQTPADIAGHVCLQYRYPSTGRLETWPLRDAPEQFRIPESMVCNNVETRVCFAIRGRGIAYVPDYSARAALQDGRLVTVLDAHLDAAGNFHLLWPSGRHVLPKLRVFIDFVSTRLMDMVAGGTGTPGPA
ncbi:LysR family transcriptional regulator [Luteimonas sp. XNQY3]|nr:LysR family transcriptional regulator [Luteimonas sp. XNQY3]